MRSLRISESCSLPIDAVTQTFAILAKRGVGKTYTASVLAEEMLEAGQQVIAIDPTGAWWGLRSKYPIVILGGEHADLPLEKTSGEIVAKAIVDNGFSAIIDLSLFRKGELIHFMTAFAETLYRLNRNAVHLFVDEADAVAPQGRSWGSHGKDESESRMLGAMEDIVRRGRKRGIGCTLITQRPAVLNKNVLTQCEVLITMRLVHPKDIDAVEEWVNVHADPKQAKEMIASLPSLPIGNAWIWSPGWADLFTRIEVRRRHTFDSGATPKAGEVAKKPKHMAAVDLDALGEQIKATVEAKKANDPKELHARIRNLEVELKAAQIAKPAPEQKVVEKPVLKDKQLQRIESFIDWFNANISKFTDAIGELNRTIKPAFALRNQPNPPVRLTSVASQSKPAVRPSSPPAQNGSLGKCERAILSVLAQFPEGCNSGKLTLLSGYRFSGSFSNSLGSLRTAGFIVGGNRDVMRITEEGLSQGPFEQLPQGRDLIDYWVNNANFGLCARTILSALVDHPKGLDSDKLCEITGYSFSGSFSNALGELRTVGVIVGRNSEVMRLSDELLESL